MRYIDGFIKNVGKILNPHCYLLYCQIETANTYKFQSTIDTIQADTIYNLKKNKHVCCIWQ